MPKLNIRPVTKSFVLTTAGDDQDPAKIVVRQATSGDVRRLEEIDPTSSITELFTNPNNGQKMEVQRRWIQSEKVAYRVFFTLAGCNLLNDEDDKPLFTFNDDGRLKDEAAFMAMWDALPFEVGSEIYKFVLEMNPQWDDSPN